MTRLTASVRPRWTTASRIGVSGSRLGIGDLVPVDQDEIGSLADPQATDPAAKGCGRRTADSRHAQHLAGARDVVVFYPRHAMRAQYHAHLLQHVAIVV